MLLPGPAGCPERSESSWRRRWSWLWCPLLGEEEEEEEEDEQSKNKKKGGIRTEVKRESRRQKKWTCYINIEKTKQQGSLCRGAGLCTA